MIRVDGSFVWQEPADGVPAVDTEAENVARHGPGGAIEGLDIDNGARVWRISADEAEQTQATVAFGADGWLVRTAGGSAMVYRSRSGQPWYSGPFQGSDPHRWSGGTYVTWTGSSSLVGVSGPSFPPLAGEENPTDLVFLRR